MNTASSSNQTPTDDEVRRITVLLRAALRLHPWVDHTKLQCPFTQGEPEKPVFCYRFSRSEPYNACSAHLLIDMIRGTNKAVCPTTKRPFTSAMIERLARMDERWLVHGHPFRPLLVDLRSLPASSTRQEQGDDALIEACSAVLCSALEYALHRDDMSVELISSSYDVLENLDRINRRDVWTSMKDAWADMAAESSAVACTIRRIDGGPSARRAATVPPQPPQFMSAIPSHANTIRPAFSTPTRTRRDQGMRVVPMLSRMGGRYW